MTFINLSKCIKRICQTKTIIINGRVFLSSLKPPWNILFFGADSFSVHSLKVLSQEYKFQKLINNLEVVTTVKAKSNPVEIFARKENLITHKWPVKLEENKFDVGIVVSFGVLIPEDIINKFPLGILNVHASLLPRWRGAAPIIYTISHQDEIAGVTIMKIRPRKFDIGEIIKQNSVKVHKHVKLPELYEQLAALGASTLISCVYELPKCLEKAVAQSENNITYAPKILPTMAHVNWLEMTAKQVYALWRALFNLYPLTTSWNNLTVKLHSIEFSESARPHCHKGIILPGSVEYDKYNQALNIQCKDGLYVAVKTIGLIGKKPMTAKDFNNGYLSKEFVHNRKFK